MKLGLSLTLALLAAWVSTASAQVGIYGKLAYLHDHDASSNTSQNYYGPDVGVYDDFIHLGPVQAGLDLRTDFLFADQRHFRTVLAGARLGLRVPVVGVKPYVQGSIGAGGETYTGARAAGIPTGGYNTKLTYGVFGGVDITVLPHVDFRAVEVGYLRRSGVNGSANNNPAETLIQVSSGVVFRF